MRWWQKTWLLKMELFNGMLAALGKKKFFFFFF
jgi:hypothetical protein